MGLKKSKKPEPEIGQLVWRMRPSKPTFVMPNYAVALFEGILSDLETVYWNMFQDEWDRIDTPGVKGISWRPFSWSDDIDFGGSPKSKAPKKPNMHSCNVDIWWYKYPGRGMEYSHKSGKELTPKDWVEWYDDTSLLIRAAQRKHDKEKYGYSLS